MALQPLGVPRHLCKPSPGRFRNPHPAPAASHLQELHTRPEAPILARARRASPARLGSRARESGSGRPATAEGVGGGLKVERWDALEGAFPGPRGRTPWPLQGGESEGTTRDPRRSQHARPDSTTLPGPSGPRRGLWDCESFGAIGPRRRPASGLQLPRSRARPCGFWELWSRALRERARRGARELRVPGRSAAGAGAGGLNGGSPAPRQGCVGCGGCGRRRRPGPACGPGG